MYPFLFHDYIAFVARDLKGKNVLKSLNWQQSIKTDNYLNISTTFLPVYMYIVFKDIALYSNILVMKEKYCCCQFEEQCVISLAAQINPVMKGLNILQFL